MFKKLRTFLGCLTLLGFALLFLDLSLDKIWASHLAWLAKMQFLPAFLAHSFIIVAVILLLTLIFGRIYCSILCPLGLTQDLLLNLLGKKKFSYLPKLTFLRLGILVLFLASLIWGLPQIFDLLDPYSNFGRMITTIGQPIAILINNALDTLTQGHFQALAPKNLPLIGMSALGTAVSLLLLLLILGQRYGRIFCNTLCPIGIILGFLSRFAIFRPRINAAKCTSCGQCSRNCKANCIDYKNQTIDASRCVACFNCTTSCKFGALTLTKEDDQPLNQSRRNSLGKIALGPLFLLGASSKVQAQTEKSEAEILNRSYKPRREHTLPILPSGAQSLEHFASHCTGCQLCVAACPSQILISQDTGQGFLQPNLSFEKNYCHPSCVKCSQVCPTGAILPITREEKSSLQIGQAHIDFRLCLVNTEKVTCQACQRNCPTGAISLVGNTELKQPTVNFEACIGCGACEHYCPVRPISAIKVFGNKVHRSI
ncbi:MAG: 4Fe-4S binding protein [Desulfovibrionaceae bacterium]|nr:4Fe-4S binding protein [Desulfovibrionaceae bacterium]